jgi:hypothetical protein
MAGKLVAEDVPTIITRLGAGESYARVAGSYGVSEGLIRRVKAGWVPKSKADIAALRDRQAHGRRSPLPDGQKQAHDTVARALLSGKIVRRPCWCGNSNVQAHHHNGYAREHRLDVTWLCDRHHKDEHNKLRAEQRAAPVDKPVDKPVDTVDTSTPSRRPSFLAAPDDDCGVCGHDRQSYHLGPTCTMGVLRGGRRSFCGCPAFVDPAEPF